jgi:hypothetical protein
MNKLTIVAALAMTGLVACNGDKDTDSGAATGTTGTTTGTTGTGTTGPGNPTASVTWGAASVDVTISGGPGAYWFGMAETVGCDDCWTGEDCVYGYDASGTTLAYCHDGTDTGTSLTYGGNANALDAGTTVFADAAFDGSVTYYLESDPDFGGDGSCYVWGADNSYYDGLGCTAL